MAEDGRGERVRVRKTPSVCCADTSPGSPGEAVFWLRGYLVELLIGEEWGDGDGEGVGDGAEEFGFGGGDVVVGGGIGGGMWVWSDGF